MNRFFVNKKDMHDSTAIIKGEDLIHIQRVLRLGAGDYIELCDGEGMDYEARIQTLEKSFIEAEIINEYTSKGEPQVKITLYQGIPKGSKMDLIIQKCVELGVYEIVPVITARTVVKLETVKEQEKKVNRWQKIAEEAAKQSRRGIIPVIRNPMPYKHAASQSGYSLKIIPWENEREKGLKTLLKGANNGIDTAAILVGPEGGFEEEEVLQATKDGWVSITLGSRILRTETVGMAMLSMIMFHLEELE